MHTYIYLISRFEISNCTADVDLLLLLCVLSQLSPNRALYAAGKECDGILWSFLHKFKV